jgi:hypothetical protein
MVNKIRLSKIWLAQPTVILTIRVLILVAVLTLAVFANTGVVHADPGWGGVGGH